MQAQATQAQATHHGSELVSNAAAAARPEVTATRVTRDVDLIGTYVPIPGLGVLPVQAYLIHAAQPVLIDTGVGAMQEAFLDAIGDRIAFEDIEWIYLTHIDADHTGCLRELLSLAPRARVVTTFLGAGKLGLTAAVAPERLYLLNPGQSLDAGDRRLLAHRPPVFDAPETTALLDTSTRTLFSSDCFGGLLAEPHESAAQLAPAALREGVVTWARVDSPWLSLVDREALGRSIEALRALAPETVLSSHLPPAPASLLPSLCEALAQVPSEPLFVGPDQAAMEQVMAAG